MSWSFPSMGVSPSAAERCVGGRVRIPAFPERVIDRDNAFQAGVLCWHFVPATYLPMLIPRLHVARAFTNTEACRA